ncbi:MAG TPA: hypothetical protein VF586_09890, partial [Pyrinomonadaceae bacterium]
MEHQVNNHWVLIRFRVGPSGSMEAAYEDSRGVRFDPGGVLRATSRRLLTETRFGNGRIVDLIREMCAHVTALRHGPHANGPTPLAIFVDPPKAPLLSNQHLYRLDWEDVLEGLVPPDVGRDRVEVVLLAQRRWTRRPPFRLPMRVLAVGRRGRDALRNLRDAGWLRHDPEVQQYGLQVREVEPREATAALRAEERDIVVTDEESVDLVLRAAAAPGRAAQTRPRLVIFLGHMPDRLYAQAVSLPPGLSLLWVPLTDEDYETTDWAAEFVKGFFYGIIHDYPQHEALRAAMRDAPPRDAAPPGAGYPLLIADPLSNLSLSMSDAAAQLLDDAFTLNHSLSALDARHLDDLLLRIGRGASDTHPDNPAVDSLRRVYALSEDADAVRTALDFTRGLTYDFGQEMLGMAPLARGEAVVARARESERRLGHELVEAAGDSRFVEAVQQHQERRVDVALQHLEGIPVYRPVDPRETLRRGGRYRVRVHIGNRLADSLVAGEVPSIDLLLPEQEERRGHDLQAVLIECDFALLSPRVQPLYLPPLGGTQPVYFEVRAPGDGDAARARVEVYYRNHLLQAFQLEARLGPEAETRADVQVSVRLLSSTTARFTNLDELGPRTLALSLEGPGAGPKQVLSVKSGKGAQPLSLPPDLVDEQLELFRGILKDATADADGYARFSTDAGPGDKPSPYFEVVVRRLADLGNELHRRIFKEMPEQLREDMRGLAATADETIQVIRYGMNYAFPWNVLYDFRLPDPDEDAPPPPVCLGVKEAPAGAAPPGPAPLACGHGPDDGVYCVWGFWGLRHRVEELVALGDSLSNVKPYVERSPRGPAAAVMVGTPDDHTARMVKDLRDMLGDDLVVLTEEDDLLKFLWTPEKRPAVLIVLGHMQTTPRPARIQLASGPKQRWLSAKNLDDQLFRGKEWKQQPNSLVLLMACSSGATEMTTVNDFISAWTSVGAAGIVGTECLTFTRFVSFFATEVTRALLSRQEPKSVGDAVKEFNRRMITAG